MSADVASCSGGQVAGRWQVGGCKRCGWVLAKGASWWWSCTWLSVSGQRVVGPMCCCCCSTRSAQHPPPPLPHTHSHHAHAFPPRAKNSHHNCHPAIDTRVQTHAHLYPHLCPHPHQHPHTSPPTSAARARRAEMSFFSSPPCAVQNLAPLRLMGRWLAVTITAPSYSYPVAGGRASERASK